MGSIWITEVAAEDDDLPVSNGPSDVLARIRAGAFEESWADREARRQDAEHAERQAAARERQADYADALRLRGIDPPTLAESIAMRSEATFMEQDRHDRIRDKRMAELIEQEGGERRLREQVQRELARERESKRALLREVNDVPASRHRAETERDSYARAAYGRF
jgi:hypothetical protein